GELRPGLALFRLKLAPRGGGRSGKPRASLGGGPGRGGARARTAVGGRGNSEPPGEAALLVHRAHHHGHPAEPQEAPDAERDLRVHQRPLPLLPGEVPRLAEQHPPQSLAQRLLRQDPPRAGQPGQRQLLDARPGVGRHVRQRQLPAAPQALQAAAAAAAASTHAPAPRAAVARRGCSGGGPRRLPAGLRGLRSLWLRLRAGAPGLRRTPAGPSPAPASTPARLCFRRRRRPLPAVGTPGPCRGASTRTSDGLGVRERSLGSGPCACSERRVGPGPLGPASLPGRGAWLRQSLLPRVPEPSRSGHRTPAPRPQDGRGWRGRRGRAEAFLLYRPHYGPRWRRGSTPGRRRGLPRVAVLGGGGSWGSGPGLGHADCPGPGSSGRPRSPLAPRGRSPVFRAPVCRQSRRPQWLPL
ncbi:hypothetical protein K5549_017244, partial [Capra hircus]